ncbi:hypothetical protein V499_00844 [Pseudogymnoascus sp. VKM F-103]|nr:hypothetical protein V499_00844 [Pseudogymnoascus sp. VKM F-103]
MKQRGQAGTVNSNFAPAFAANAYERAPAMDGQKAEPTPLIPTANSQTDGNGISPRSDQARLIPGSIAFLIFLGIAALYLSATHLLNRASVSMSLPHTNDMPLIPITVSLSPLAAPQDVSPDDMPYFSVNVTLTNTGDVTLIVLKWHTPFAHGAPAMGIFKVTDLWWGTAVPDMGLMVDYLFPEGGIFVHKQGNKTSDNLLLIRPGEGLSEEVKIGGSAMSIKRGKKHSVKAKGRWMAVWLGEDDNGRYSMRDSIQNGLFESEAVEVQT